MRKLYNEFFGISKHGKIREKVMLTRVVTTIAIIILCLASMSITAYAYFSYSITSGSNIIKAAHFETRISIQGTDQNRETVVINPITGNYQTHKIELEADKVYTVTITPENSTAKTGFVVITADGCDETYHTQQLGVDTSASAGETTTFSFKMTVTDKTVVYFLAHWGTSSHYDAYKNKGENNGLYVTQDEEIELVIKAADNNKENENSGTVTTTSGTTSPATTTTTVATTEPTASTNTTTPLQTTHPSETTATTESATTTSATTTEVVKETKPLEQTTGTTTEVSK